MFELQQQLRQHLLSAGLPAGRQQEGGPQPALPDRHAGHARREFPAGAALPAAELRQRLPQVASVLGSSEWPAFQQQVLDSHDKYERQRQAPLAAVAPGLADRLDQLTGMVQEQREAAKAQAQLQAQALAQLTVAPAGGARPVRGPGFGQLPLRALRPGRRLGLGRGGVLMVQVREARPPRARRRRSSWPPQRGACPASPCAACCWRCCGRCTAATRPRPP